MSHKSKVGSGLISIAVAGGALYWSMQPAQTNTVKTTAAPVKVATPIKNVGRVATLPKPKPKELMNPNDYAAYKKAIEETAAMTSDEKAQKLAQKHGLQVLNVTWEDTGRYKDSAVGPNISDMTIQVGARDPKTEAFNVTCMPVIRFPNFSDKSADLDPRDFTLLVGNQNGERFKTHFVARFSGKSNGLFKRAEIVESAEKIVARAARQQSPRFSTSLFFASAQTRQSDVQSGAVQLSIV